MEDFDGNTAHAVYSLFSVGDIDVNYRLKVGEYSGNAGKIYDSRKERTHFMKFLFDRVIFLSAVFLFCTQLACALTDRDQT